MKNGTLSKIILGVFLLIPFTDSFSDDDICGYKEKYFNTASSIRELKIKNDVPCYVWTQDKVKGYLVQSLGEHYTDEELGYEALISKALGMVPDDYAYKDGILNLITSQLGGFYDEKKKFFVAIKLLSLISQEPVMVHELTHALQDQHYNIVDFVDKDKFSADEILARTALIEGDATAVMLDFVAMHNRNGKKVSQMDSVLGLMLQTVLGKFFDFNLSSAPTVLVANLIFPYTSGLRFVHNFLKGKDYKEIDKLFQRPPRSTEEILHIEKYLQEEPDFITFSDEDVFKKFTITPQKVLYRIVVGEFNISALLKGLGIKNNIEVATGWGGDQVLVIEQDNAKKILWLTAWDSEEDAKEFFEAYRDVIKNHSQNNLYLKNAKIANSGKDVTLLFEM